ncbi:hypothetical protein Tco_0575601 [Tanacetum coccineum]
MVRIGVVEDGLRLLRESFVEIGTSTTSVNAAMIQLAIKWGGIFLTGFPDEIGVCTSQDLCGVIYGNTSSTLRLDTFPCREKKLHISMSWILSCGVAFFELVGERSHCLRIVILHGLRNEVELYLRLDTTTLVLKVVETSQEDVGPLLLLLSGMPVSNWCAGASKTFVVCIVSSTGADWLADCFYERLAATGMETSWFLDDRTRTSVSVDSFY